MTLRISPPGWIRKSETCRQHFCLPPSNGHSKGDVWFAGDFVCFTPKSRPFWERHKKTVHDPKRKSRTLSNRGFPWTPSPTEPYVARELRHGILAGTVASALMCPSCQSRLASSITLGRIVRIHLCGQRASLARRPSSAFTKRAVALRSPANRVRSTCLRG